MWRPDLRHICGLQTGWGIIGDVAVSGYNVPTKKMVQTVYKQMPSAQLNAAVHVRIFIYTNYTYLKGHCEHE